MHEPPNPEHFAPKTPRERRQAWKEGRLGYNPNPEIPKEVTKKRVTPSNKRKKKRPEVIKDGLSMALRMPWQLVPQQLDFLVIYEYCIHTTSPRKGCIP